MNEAWFYGGKKYLEKSKMLIDIKKDEEAFQKLSKKEQERKLNRLASSLTTIEWKVLKALGGN